ncbi:hypothetical protein Smp_014270 [Schistosoma mansoni]|uniref:hypothetical protein n=1 Tax=Schistosoma mansoni TaxID=6183 RepID=UPI0001A63B71|nr:hypothetical protein Smp_014270 [Schistosoma mansoni]|eukprot:XP_018648054.1 hypothetical protein Smp_014270 [Schistosoma mansoni]
MALSKKSLEFLKSITKYHVLQFSRGSSPSRVSSRPRASLPARAPPSAVAQPPAQPRQPGCEYDVQVKEHVQKYIHYDLTTKRKMYKTILLDNKTNG